MAADADKVFEGRFNFSRTMWLREDMRIGKEVLEFCSSSEKSI